MRLTIAVIVVVLLGGEASSQTNNSSWRSLTVDDIDQMIDCSFIILRCSTMSHQMRATARYFKNVGRGWNVTIGVHSAALVDDEHVRARSDRARLQVAHLEELGGVGALKESFVNDCLVYQPLVYETMRQLRLQTLTSRSQD